MQQHMHNSVDLGHHCLLFSKPIFVFWLQFQLSGLWQWRISRTVSQSTAVNLLVANSQAQALSAPIIGLPRLWLVTPGCPALSLAEAGPSASIIPVSDVKERHPPDPRGFRVNIWPGTRRYRSGEISESSQLFRISLPDKILSQLSNVVCGIDQRYESRVLCRVYTELMFPYIRSKQWNQYTVSSELTWAHTGHCETRVAMRLTITVLWNPRPGYEFVAPPSPGVPMFVS